MKEKNILRPVLDTNGKIGREENDDKASQTTDLLITNVAQKVDHSNTEIEVIRDQFKASII